MKPITYSIIFDLDGTLVHSVPDMHYAINKTLKEYNLKNTNGRAITNFCWRGDVITCKESCRFLWRR